MAKSDNGKSDNQMSPACILAFPNASPLISNQPRKPSCPSCGGAGCAACGWMVTMSPFGGRRRAAARGRGRGVVIRLARPPGAGGGVAGRAAPLRSSLCKQTAPRPDFFPARSGISA